MINIKTKILIAIISLAVISALIGAPLIEKDYILLKINYENGNFTLLDKSLEKGYYPTLNHDPHNEYKINLISTKNNSLYTNSFDPTSLYSDIPSGEELGGGIIKLSKIEFYLILPSDDEGDKVEILKDGEKVFEEEVYDVGAKSCRIR